MVHFPLRKNCFNLACPFLVKVYDLIHRTSHTLQLLIEYDPVRQRLDRLRLGSPRNQMGVPATSRMRLSSPSDTVLERTDEVDDGMLKRRSMKYARESKMLASSLFLVWAYRPLKCLYLSFFRRSNSICKSPNSLKETPIITRDIGRSESLRSSSSCSHRIFRPCDLIHGEVLGKGFFGQAIKVSLQLPSLFPFSISSLSRFKLQIILAFVSGDSQSHWGGDGDEGADPLWWGDAENFSKGGE